MSGYHFPELHGGFVDGLRKSEVPENMLNELPPVSNDPGTVIRRIRAGMPMAEFVSLGAWLKLNEDDLAKLLGISRATLHRRRKAGRLGAPESEKLVRFAQLMARATEVLEDEEAAREWLKSPAYAFRGETPLAFSDTEIGAREVEMLLGRLEHGVFS